MGDWIYFAAKRKASLASTLETVLGVQFLWRSAFSETNTRIANVSSIEAGDHIVVAWRGAGSMQTAYLRCRVAAPISPLKKGTVIDKVEGAGANVLTSAGYPKNSDGAVEGFRLDEIVECYFQVKGKYGGRNAIHKLGIEDSDQILIATTIPPMSFAKPVKRTPDSAAQSEKAAPVEARNIELHFEIEATDDDRAFDAYFMVDWSSSASPVTGNDSIWIGSGAWNGRKFNAGSPKNFSTRAEAVKELRKEVVQWREEGKRVLVGFDFAFGYPAGFANALGLTSEGRAWKALHQYFASNVSDTPQNGNNRDAFADECNRKVGAPGPFWGCNTRAVTPSLTQQHVGIFQFPHHQLEEWRATDLASRRRVTTQSVWKLNCGVSVGGQTILGIKYLDDLARAVGGHRWPFEGWTTPTGPAIWFAEIFPSLVQYSDWAAEYEKRRDRTQVQSCVRRAAERDSAGKLKRDFAKPGWLDAETLARVEDEEGWILWVEQSKIRRKPSASHQ